MLQQISTNTNNKQLISPQNNTINKAYLAFAYGRNDLPKDTFTPSTQTQYYNDEKKAKKKEN